MTDSGKASNRLRALIDEGCAAGPGRWDVEAPDPWISAEATGLSLPVQGWKLHVSAVSASAENVLCAALPVLLAERVNFKAAGSRDVLDTLNEGVAGLSQVGKFLTVYPREDEQAVRMAKALDEATRGMRGPRVPFDMPLRPGSLVHYRYGSFSGQVEQLPTGEIADVLVDPSGMTEIEDRTVAAPAWAADPFVAAGITQEGPKAIADRYVVIGTLYRSPRGAVHLAVDTEEGRSCILKEARRDAGASGGAARDARDRLRREAEVLKALALDPRFPCVLDIAERDGDLFLVLEHIEGSALAGAVSDLLRSARLPDGELIAAWGTEAAAMLTTVHEHGWAFRDLNASNVLVTEQGLKLVDFELCCELGSTFDDVAGTPGYMSPQQTAGEPATAADDVYGLGALLYLLATGADPVDAPDPENLLARPASRMNPAIGPELEAVIVRCLDPDPASRFGAPAEVSAALSDTSASVSTAAHPYGVPLSEPPPFADLAAGIGDAIAASDERGPGSGVGQGFNRDIGAGLAGDVLLLAELAAAPDGRRFLEPLARSARRLEAAEPIPGPPLAGLFAGETGISLSLLRAARVLEDDSLLRSARLRAERVANVPFSSPDIYTGAAGRLRGHLLLAEAAGDQSHTEHAHAAASWLLSVAEDAGGGAMCWVMPDGYGNMSGASYVGYGHGAAGIADALLDLFELTGDGRYAESVSAAISWIRRTSVPALEDGSGVGFPQVEGAPPTGAAWCHGATGIGRFLLRAAKLGVAQDAEELALKAARVVARGPRSAGPTQCHGLAGNIEFLLDVADSTGDETWRREAGSLGRLLSAFAVRREGEVFWVSDAASTLGSGYLTGSAGVGFCLLRLAGHEPNRLASGGFGSERVGTG